MAFIRNQLDEIDEMMDARGQKIHVPVYTRRPLHLGRRIDGNSVILFNILSMRGEPPRIDNYDFAKATWVEKEKEWHIYRKRPLYWNRPAGKWQRYEPLKPTVNLLRFMIEVEKDPYGLFWGGICLLDIDKRK